jgi:hypothetical protein
VPAQLEDYVYLSDALISSYEITASPERLEHAIQLMNLCHERLWDREAGGFFDTENPLLGLRMKPSDDMPHPAPNPVASRVMTRLFCITDNKEWRIAAEALLRAGAGRAGAHGLHAASFFGAVDALQNGLTLKVHADPASDLAAAIRECWLPYATIRYADDQGVVIPCSMTECFVPLRSRADVKTWSNKP